MWKDYLTIVLRSLSRRKTRSYLTMIGIFIGIAAVVALIGMGEGLRTAVVSQFGFLGTDILSVQGAGLSTAGPPGTGVVNPLSDDLSKKINNVRGVNVAFDRHMESASIEFNDNQVIAMVLSMPEGELRKIVETMINLKTDYGRLLKDSDQHKIVVGNDFTQKTTFGRTVKVGDKLSINDKEFEVVGILEKKGNFMFDQVVLINVDVMLDLFGDDGTVDLIGVQVKDEKQINEVKADIEKLLRKERNVKKGKEDFSVESPQSMIESFNSTLFAVQLFVYIIAIISLLVGGVGIMNTMYTSVLERTDEIGVMKAVGARNSTIFTLFFLESGLLGMVGGTIGILFGYVLAYGGAYAGRIALGSSLIQAHISPWLAVLSLLFSFVLGTIAGLLPAIQASKLTPVDALNYSK